MKPEERVCTHDQEQSFEITYGHKEGKEGVKKNSQIQNKKCAEVSSIIIQTINFYLSVFHSLFVVNILGFF